MPSGLPSPACSAIVQRFARGNRPQAEHHHAGSTSRLDPTEPVREPTHQPIEPTQLRLEY
jgi:hypothetical protein